MSVQVLNTLYVTVPESYLRLENDTLRIEVEKEVRLRVPPHHLGSVVCFGHVGLSAPLMHRLAEEGIALVLLDDRGRFKARWKAPWRETFCCGRRSTARGEIPCSRSRSPRACVAGKIRNGRQVLLRGARETKIAEDAARLTRAADDLAASLRSIPSAGDLDTLRGVEGDAARRYFDGLGLLVRADLREVFPMDARTRRPPRDRLNALLSFIYSMWMNDCRSACEAAGLDPQIGFLHALRPGRAALALDLMEEFRPLADRLALSLINRNQVDAASFAEREGGAVMLEGDARKAVVVAYQERKQETLIHPLLSEPVALGIVPLVQARLLARAIRGDAAGYMPFLVR